MNSSIRQSNRRSDLGEKGSYLDTVSQEKGENPNEQSKRTNETTRGELKHSSRSQVQK